MSIRLKAIEAAVAAAFVAAAAVAGEKVATDTLDKTVPMYIGGTFWIENPSGDIDIIGTDRQDLVISATRVVRGVDDAAVREGQSVTKVIIGGNESLIKVQTLTPGRTPRWSSAVNYTIRVPQTVNVKVQSDSAQRIQLSDIRGRVTIKNYDGTVILHRLTGPTIVDSVNSKIIFNAPQRNLSDAQLVSINGDIEVRAPASASFQWSGGTVKGDVRTTFPARVTLLGQKFRGSVNEPGGPMISTNSLMGNIYVLIEGTTAAASRSVKAAASKETIPIPRSADQNVAAQTMRRSAVQGSFEFSTPLGDVIIGEVRGNTRIVTGAGQVQLGTIYGQCDVTSFGGPLNLGDMLGSLNARTEAGDILVQSAREGGTIATGGGIIRLLYNGGPTRLQSGGGDIVVRQAAGPINADTQSGDITVTVDPASKQEQVTAKTAKGNITLYVPMGFGADLDATIIASDSESNHFVSDFAGISVKREQIGAKTRIHATGKINGGGQRVELYAADGVITLSTHAPSPISVVTP